MSCQESDAINCGKTYEISCYVEPQRIPSPPVCCPINCKPVCFGDPSCPPKAQFRPNDRRSSCPPTCFPADCCFKPPICGKVGPFGPCWYDTPCVENPGCCEFIIENQSNLPFQILPFYLNRHWRTCHVENVKWCRMRRSSSHTLNPQK